MEEVEWGFNSVRWRVEQVPVKVKLKVDGDPHPSNLSPEEKKGIFAALKRLAQEGIHVSDSLTVQRRNFSARTFQRKDVSAQGRFSAKDVSAHGHFRSRKFQRKGVSPRGHLSGRTF